MAKVDAVSHVNFINRKSFLANNAGANVVTENVAYGFSSAQNVVNAWINNDLHRTNLEGEYTFLDISAVQNDDGKWYFTKIFIKK